MRLKRTLVALIFAASVVLIGAPPAGACDGPGDPNCHLGCDAINNVPIVNKIASCNT